MRKPDGSRPIADPTPPGQRPEPSIDWTIFTPAFALVLGVSVLLLAFPQAGEAYAQGAMDWITSRLGWLYLLFGMAVLGFSGWLAFGPYGKVCLGPPGEPPEYSNVHWVAMMFTAGIGGGVIAWGFAEPVFYIATPPLGIEPHSSAAIEWSHVYPLFHWGIIPWAMFAVPAVPIAYMLYVRRMPLLKISAACEDALPERGRQQWTILIDAVIALGIVGGTATSLALGVPLLSALLAELFGVADTLQVKVGVLIMWTMLFGASAYRGLRRGIQLLADINMGLAGLVLVYILVFGPTVFILSLTVNSLGLLFDNFWHMSMWLDPVDKGGFPEAWTIFYWAWWLAFAAFIGLFFGRISRGRTIRQVVLGVILWGSLGTWLFLAITGGYSVYLEASGQYPVTETLANEGMSVLAAKVLSQLPYGTLVLAVFSVLSIIFYATTLDSAAYVLASVCSKDLHNDQEPPRVSRLIWAACLAFLAAGLVVSGSLRTVQSSTVVFSLPLLPVMYLMTVSLIRWLREDYGRGVDKL